MARHKAPRACGLRTVALACFVAAASLVSACGGSSRSAAAVCKVWDTQGLALHNKFVALDRAQASGGASGMLSSLVGLLGAPNDLATLMSQMAAVAPSSSEPDFTALAASFTKLSNAESQAVTDPLGALGSSLLSAVAVNGSFDRVNRFLSVNCGIPGVKAPTG
jgi:hypothetical protein